VACGLINSNLWLQFGCFALSAFAMLMLNNTNALIRIYSRMVSCSFLVLSCMACFLFPSVVGGISQLLFITAYLILFFTYQDTNSPGTTYYGFLSLGLATLAWVHLFFFIPFFWLLMLTNLQSLSWRTFFASLFGVATPYVLLLSWGFYSNNLTPFIDHFSPLFNLHMPFDMSILTINQMVTFIFLVVMAIVGALHFWSTSYLDKFRIRKIYGLFIKMDIAVFFLILLQPQHYDHLIRLGIINTAPLVAHFFALTNSKLSNLTFIAATVFILLFTAYNIWMSSLQF
jgi:hypothetical protein